MTASGVDGASNSPGDGDADGEVELDIQVIGGVAPGAAQVVYFAPNTDQGFIDAVSTALHATPSPIALSMSWGASEDTWSEQTRNAMNDAFADGAALGVTVTAAAGDHGASDDPSGQTSVHADFPASSPNALACGGTRLVGSTTSFAISSEVVWNELTSKEGAGGGGCPTCSRCRPTRPAPGCRTHPAAAPAAVCRTWRATPTRSRVTWWWWTASASRSAAPPRSRRCGPG